VAPGKTSDALVSLTDVFATIADMLKFDMPLDAGEDSFSFLPVLREVKPIGPFRKDLILDSWNGVYGIRQGAWKLILGSGGGGIVPNAPSDPAVRRLYNLDSDPGETVDLSERYPILVACLNWHFRNIQFSGRSRALTGPDSICDVDTQKAVSLPLSQRTEPASTRASAAPVEALSHDY